MLWPLIYRMNDLALTKRHLKELSAIVVAPEQVAFPSICLNQSVTDDGDSHHTHLVGAPTPVDLV